MAGRGPVILDGVRLARQRQLMLADRVRRIAERRGDPPRLALVAFADDDGGAPFAARKARAANAIGVELVPLILPHDTTTAAAQHAVRTLLAMGSWDGVFVEFPYPPAVEGDAVERLIPEEADLDIMTPARMQRYLDGLDPHPPLTIAATLELLDAYDVAIAGRRGIVIAETSPFALSFGEALARRGAEMRPPVSPDAHDLDDHLRDAQLVVVSAARPGLIPTTKLAGGAVAIDVGYFNPGGSGDLDTTHGIEHLAAIAPVPGSIGPMTISMLLQRLIETAEARLHDADGSRTGPPEGPPETRP